MSCFKKIFWCPPIVITVLLLALVSPLFVFTDLDLLISSFFYHDGWIFKESVFSEWLHRFSTAPSMIYTGFFVLIFLLGFIKPAFLKYRKLALVVMMTAFIGQALVLNGIIKNAVHRPRPTKTWIFGGPYEYFRLFHFFKPGDAKSFPSGHVSSGVVFSTLFFATTAGALFRWCGLTFGLSLGLLIGIMRIAQGGHFASDVLWGGGITFFCAALSYQILNCFPSWLPAEQIETGKMNEPRFSFKQMSTWQYVGMIAFFAAFFFPLLTLAFMAIPFQSRWERILPSEANNMKKIRFTHLPEYDVRIIPVKQSDALKISSRFKGIGLPGAHLEGMLETRPTDGVLDVSLSFNADNVKMEITGAVDIFVDDKLVIELKTKNKKANIQVGDNKSPGQFGDIDISTTNGEIALALAEDSTLDGQVKIESISGNLKLNISDSDNAQAEPLRFTTESGDILLVIWSKTGTLNKPFDIQAGTCDGKLTVKANIKPPLATEIRFPEAYEKIKIECDSDWKRMPNRIRNQPDEVKTGFDLSLDSKCGDIVLILKSLSSHD